MMNRIFVVLFLVCFFLEEESQSCIVGILKLVLLINIKLFLPFAFSKPVRDYTYIQEVAEAAHKIWMVCLAPFKTLGGADDSLKQAP